MKRFLCTLALALLATPAGAAELEPPGYPAVLLNAEPTLATPPAPRLLLGNLGITLERTRLGDIARATGAPITRERESDSARDWICLSTTEAGRKLRVWLLSAEPDGAITEAQVEPAANDRRCPLLPPELMPVRVGAGLHPGQSRADVIKTAGKPSHEEDGWLLYLADRPVPAAAGKTANELNILAVKLAGGRVNRVLAAQTTSP